jgi:hypothetical protein
MSDQKKRKKEGSVREKMSVEKEKPFSTHSCIPSPK